jgi:glycerol-3-phosphate dehydrogenase
MARFAPRRFLKSLGVVSTAACTGGVVFLLSPNHSNRSTASSSILQRDGRGEVVPPRFPKLKSRAEQLATLRAASSPDSQQQFDLLVIGGGATGSGIALDAATRGLKVALIERDDFSSGTSSRSTKLVHGGVRYLEKAVWNLDYDQYELVREALRERKNFLNTAPHLTHSLPILLPLQNYWQAPYFWAGTKAYDLLAGSQGLESSYILTKKRALEAFPLLKKDIIGALVYYDGQQNDSRMNISLALTAALYGATTINHLEVTGLKKDASGRLCGATVKNLLPSRDENQSNEDEFLIHAKGIINATGPFVDSIESMDDKQRQELVAPSQGTHVVLPGHFSPNSMGMLDASTSDGRVLFLLPWEGNVVAGTTDSPCAVENNPRAKDEDITWILKEVSKYLSPDVNLQRRDVLAAWSGIRPLMRNPESTSTESLVRNHVITVSPSGLLTCAGGKWTTYRQMAEEAVDRAITEFDLTPQRKTYVDISGSLALHEERRLDGHCQTLNLKVLGAHGFSDNMFLDLIRQFGLDTDVAKHLAHSYGDRAWEIASMMENASNTCGSSDRRLSPRYPIINEEVRYAARNEYAETATDFLARRTRLSFLDAEAALAALPKVVDLMGEELLWTEARKEQEWEQTVQFLGTMGLEIDRVGITREDFEEGFHTAPEHNVMPVPTTEELLPMPEHVPA